MVYAVTADRDVRNDLLATALTTLGDGGRVRLLSTVDRRPSAVDHAQSVR